MVFNSESRLYEISRWDIIHDSFPLNYHCSLFSIFHHFVIFISEISVWWTVMLFNQMTRPHYPRFRARTNPVTTQLSPDNSTPWSHGEAGENGVSTKLDFIQSPIERGKLICSQRQHPLEKGRDRQKTSRRLELPAKSQRSCASTKKPDLRLQDVHCGNLLCGYRCLCLPQVKANVVGLQCRMRQAVVKHFDGHYRKYLRHFL